MFHRLLAFGLPIFAALFAMAATSTILAQGVIEVAGESGANSTATEFDVTPTQSGELEFYAVPDDGSAFLTVQTVDVNTFLVRMDFA